MSGDVPQSSQDTPRLGSRVTISHARGHPVSKRARKRRSRKTSKANHGRRPNA
jgi:hypothetical protein